MDIIPRERLSKRQLSGTPVRIVLQLHNGVGKRRANIGQHIRGWDRIRSFAEVHCQGWVVNGMTRRNIVHEIQNHLHGTDEWYAKDHIDLEKMCFENKAEKERLRKLCQ